MRGGGQKGVVWASVSESGTVGVKDEAGQWRGTKMEGRIRMRVRVGDRG